MLERSRLPPAPRGPVLCSRPPSGFTRSIDAQRGREKAEGKVEDGAGETAYQGSNTEVYIDSLDRL